MKKVNISLPRSLLREVDRIARDKQTTRSALARQLLQDLVDGENEPVFESSTSIPCSPRQGQIVKELTCPVVIDEVSLASSEPFRYGMCLETLHGKPDRLRVCIFTEHHRGKRIAATIAIPLEKIKQILSYIENGMFDPSLPELLQSVSPPRMTLLEGTYEPP